MKMNKFYCNVCSKVFKQKSNMYRHRKKTHGCAEKEDYICAHCGLKFNLKKKLIQHLKKYHDFPSEAECTSKGVAGARLKCPECNTHLKSYEFLDAHLLNLHNIDIVEEYLEFDNEGAFKVWKLNLEKETQSQYVAERGLRKRSTYSQREYICHRSYNARKKSDSRKRSLKSLGTNKIDAACPSRMIVRITGEKVTVKFTPVHVGHCTEVSL